MAEQDSPPRVDPYQVAEIVSSYVRHHQIAADQLAGSIVEVHRALASLGRPPPAQEPPTPAVPIRRSVRQDYVVCLECGFCAQVLRRHLRVAHGLEVADYRARWRLSTDYPVTAELFGAAHEDGQGDRSRAPRRSGTEPAGVMYTHKICAPVSALINCALVFLEKRRGSRLPLRNRLSAESDAIPLILGSVRPRQVGVRYLRACASPRDVQRERRVGQGAGIIEALHPDRGGDTSAIRDNATPRRQRPSSQGVRLDDAKPSVRDLDVRAWCVEPDLVGAGREPSCFNGVHVFTADGDTARVDRRGAHKVAVIISSRAGY
jgi:predicted transcriptional regulator